MKKLVVVGLLSTLTFNVMAVEKETIEIIKPLIKLKEAKIDTGDGLEGMAGAMSEVKTSGSIQSTFASKEECIRWTSNSAYTLQKASRTIFSATCSNEELAPLWFDAGHFVGNVTYL